jgi:hypothetical protein
VSAHQHNADSPRPDIRFHILMKALHTLQRACASTLRLRAWMLVATTTSATQLSVIFKRHACRSARYCCQGGLRDPWGERRTEDGDMSARAMDAIHTHSISSLPCIANRICSQSATSHRCLGGGQTITKKSLFNYL